MNEEGRRRRIWFKNKKKLKTGGRGKKVFGRGEVKKKENARALEWEKMETERERGERKGRARRQGEDRSRSWANETSIDTISRCLFAHSPLCIKGAVRAAGRPRALHLITWHANRCYGLIRAPRPPFPLHLRLPPHKGEKGRWRRRRRRRKEWRERGKEAEEGGEEIKYFMMTWCKKINK